MITSLGGARAGQRQALNYKSALENTLPAAPTRPPPVPQALGSRRAAETRLEARAGQQALRL